MINRSFAALVCATLFAAGMSGCGTPSRQQVGIGTGAVVGGIVGHSVTDGSTLGTVGGAAVGGLIGNEVTKKK